MRKSVLKSIIVFLLAVAGGFLLICAVYLLPTERTCLHVRESGETLGQEGDYYLLLPKDGHTRLDNFTDAIMLLTSSYNGEESIIDKAINNYRIYVKKQPKAVSCQNCGLPIDEKYKQVYSYSRYWHGYMVVLKPLLLFLNLDEIRQLNLFVILTEMLIIGTLMYRRKIAIYLIPFALAIAFLNPITVSASLQNSTSFHVMMTAIILLLSLWDKKYFQQHLYLFFLCTGMITSYVDFLTYPVVTLGFPLIIYFILNDCRKISEGIRRLLQYSVLWCVGYGGMWASKWILATVLTGQNHVQDGISKIVSRSGSDIGNGLNATLIDVYQAQLDYFSQSILRHILLVLLIAEICILVIKRIRPEKWKTSLILICVTLYPFIWYGCVKNHSTIHCMFTYRGLSVFIMGTTSFLLPNICGKKIKKFIHIQKQEALHGNSQEKISD